jgi:urease accessory protein
LPASGQIALGSTVFLVLNMLALLLQWADSAYPTGGFAYSNGLEAMARWPAFGTLDHLRDYLHLVLEQAYTADLPFLMDMQAVFDFKDVTPFLKIAWEWDAFLHQPTLRRASLAQGVAWLRLYGDSHPGMTFPSTQAPTHFLAALASTAKHAELSPPSLCDLYLHLILRDQLAAAVRLGLLGSNQAQTLQTQVGPAGNSHWKDKIIGRHTQATRCAPVLELVQSLHPHLYVKLFQN